MLRALLASALLLVSLPLAAMPLRVAVASNFLLPLEAIARAYADQGGASLRISAGATGQHYAQIINGAPFDVFLAADQARPQRLLDEGFALPDSQMTYALGRLVLWAGANAELPSSGLGGLVEQMPRRLAIASPRLAPYGAAAQQALQATGQWEALRPLIVEGKNISQTLHLLATGNASHALVAASFTVAANRPPGEWVLIDESLYEPIRQDAVILKSARDPAEAQRFLAFLQGAAAQEILQRFGYGMVEDG